MLINFFLDNLYWITKVYKIEKFKIGLLVKKLTNLIMKNKLKILYFKVIYKTFLYSFIWEFLFLLKITYKKISKIKIKLLKNKK